MIINGMASGAGAYNWTAERVQQRLVEVDRPIRILGPLLVRRPLEGRNPFRKVAATQSRPRGSSTDPQV